VASARSGRVPLVDPEFDDWAAREVRAGDLGQILAAGVALGGFDSSSWVGDIDVPTTVLIGVDDSVVPTARQRQLATALPQPLVVEFSGDHVAPVVRADHFATQLTTGISWLHGG
jgi:3-oxoadipate enol-lactonase